MTALQFQASLNPDGTLNVPEDVAAQLKDVSSFKVVLFVNVEEDDDEDWRRLGLSQFFQGYADSDAIYDDL